MTYLISNYDEFLIHRETIYNFKRDISIKVTNHTRYYELLHPPEKLRSIQRRMWDLGPQIHGEDREVNDIDNLITP